MNCSCVQDDVCGDLADSEVVEIKVVNVTEVHFCQECGRVIERGTCYEVYNCAGNLYKTCQDCLSVRQLFFKCGWTFGLVWEDVRDLILECGEVSEEQLASLTSFARSKVCEIIEDIWEEENR